MNFSTAQIEQIRLCILRCLDAASGTRYGLSSADLLQMVRADGFSKLDKAGMASSLNYLASGKLIEQVPKTISPENPYWRITKEGMDFYALQQADNE